MMKPPVHRGLSFAAALAMALVVAACGERSEDTTASTSADTAGSRTAAAGRDVKDSAKQGVHAAGSKLDEAGQASREGSENASTGVMGAAADARGKAYSPASGETKIDDTKLTAMVLTGLKADKELNPLRIDVDTRDGVVTLSGSVPSAAAKARASEIAQNVKDVKSVNNQLTLTTG
jgi:osmotically-inducible protein OsmY